ncbi:MAG: DNA-directed RNA polymerase subunit H [Halobacteriota archaeon]
MSKTELQDHVMVPTHEILDEEETQEFLKALGIDKEQLPKIRADDPVIKEIGAKIGDVVRIIRESSTAGKSVVYRLVA